MFYFNTTEVAGVIELPDGVDAVIPGDSGSLIMTLDKPIYRQEGYEVLFSVMLTVLLVLELLSILSVSHTRRPFPPLFRCAPYEL